MSSRVWCNAACYDLFDAELIIDHQSLKVSFHVYVYESACRRAFSGLRHAGAGVVSLRSQSSRELTRGESECHKP